MVRQIIYKEVLENVLTLRFALSLILIIFLFAAGGFIFVGKYKQQTEDYWKETNDNLSAIREQSNQLYKSAFYKQEIFRKPKPLAVCSEGFEKFLPNCFKSNAFTIDLPKIKGRSNFILPHFSDINWVFIISLIFSFMALIFTYDSICGEKQAGTLRLMLAGSIPRYKVLVGKYLGVMFVLGVSLLIGMLINLIILFSFDIVIGAGDWLKIFTIILLSFLYLSIFVLLGIFLSARMAYSANCMAILLLIWVGLVILIPSFGKVISGLSGNGSNATELARRIHDAREQVDDRCISGEYGERAGALHPDPDNPMNNHQGRARYNNALTDAENRVLEEHHNQILDQAFTGRNLTCISPTVIYQRASEAIAGTGINRCVSLYQQIKRYQSNLKQFILDRDSEDADSLHLLFDEKHTIVNWNAISKKPVDFDTVPKFQEQDLALGESLQLAIWDIGLLVLFNLAFFAAAFVSFLRYDVR